MAFQDEPFTAYDSILKRWEIAPGSEPSCPSKNFPFVLQNHQLDIAKMIKHFNVPLLAWHGLGSGKTITSMMTAI